MFLKRIQLPRRAFRQLKNSLECLSSRWVKDDHTDNVKLTLHKNFYKKKDIILYLYDLLQHVLLLVSSLQVNYIVYTYTPVKFSKYGFYFHIFIFIF